MWRRKHFNSVKGLTDELHWKAKKVHNQDPKTAKYLYTEHPLSLFSITIRFL